MSRSYDSDAFRIVSWYANEARLKSFAATGKLGKTIVKIELEVTDPSAIGSIMSDLQKASAPYKPAPQPKAATPRRLAAPPLALPAPQLQLIDGRAK